MNDLSGRTMALDSAPLIYYVDFFLANDAQLSRLAQPQVLVLGDLT